MGCNCKNRRKSPYGTGNNRPTPNVDKPVKPTPKTTQSFSLITPDRRVQTFGSRLEAQAALVRAGGVGTIKPS